ncbi:MAG: polysaccharide deacetylase family protein [Propionibacteriaceae bacterium]|nr:polysaccharide deacetylase family protein [Propionibacteriaceae bacterium]
MSRPVLVRGRYACAYESGPRPVDTIVGADGPLSPMAGLLARAVRPLTAYCSAVTSERVVALTYDDGPDPDHTPGVLDALRAGQTRATFFVLVERAQAHPDLVQRIVAEGHEVGLHGRDHRRISAAGLAASMREIRAARQELARLAGQPVRWYRPAYGAIRIDQQLAVRALGLDVPVWSAWARDWEDEEVSVLAERAAAALHPGGVMLLHDASAGLAPDDSGLTHQPTFDRGELTRRLLIAAEGMGYRLTTLGGLAKGYPQGRVPWFESRAKARAGTGA